jgi:hypothetical protein
MFAESALAGITIPRQTQITRPVVTQSWVDVSRPTISVEDVRVLEWDRIIRKLHEMLTLRDDWDGMGAIAPPRDVVFSALDLAYHFRALEEFPAPTRVAPTPSGTIGLEWQQPSVYTEAEILASSRSEWMQMKDGENPVHWVHHGLPDTDFVSGLTPMACEGPGLGRVA